MQPVVSNIPLQFLDLILSIFRDCPQFVIAGSILSRIGRMLEVGGGKPENVGICWDTSNIAIGKERGIWKVRGSRQEEGQPH